MRIAKLLALALRAVLFLGMGAALAQGEVVLCKASEEPCRGENVTNGSFTATAEATLDFGEIGTVKCSSSLTQSEMSQISALPFSGCSEGCTAKAIGLPFNEAYFELSEGSSKLLIFNGGYGEPALAVKCGTAECVFSASTIETEFKGGKAASIPVSKSLTETAKSLFCPETVKWSATYLTSPASLFVANRAVEGPGFCMVNKELCPQESIVSEVINTLSEPA